MALQDVSSATRSAWTLDPAHTLVAFSAKHMMFTTVKGRFKAVRGTILTSVSASRCAAVATVR